jgi:hypothetical protein
MRMIRVKIANKDRQLLDKIRQKTCVYREARKNLE